MDTTLEAAFVGAAATLLAGYVTTFFAERYKRFHEGTAVAAAIVGELNSYSTAWKASRAALELLLEAAETGQTLEIPEPKYVGDAIFEANISRLGLLDPETVEDVVFVYHQLRAYRAHFGLAVISNDAAQRVSLKACMTFLSNMEEHGRVLITNLRQRSNCSFAVWLLPRWFRAMLLRRPSHARS